jgi:hypothetical protein
MNLPLPLAQKPASPTTTRSPRATNLSRLPASFGWRAEAARRIVFPVSATTVTTVHLHVTYYAPSLVLVPRRRSNCYLVQQHRCPINANRVAFLEPSVFCTRVTRRRQVSVELIWPRQPCCQAGRSCFASQALDPPALCSLLYFTLLYFTVLYLLSCFGTFAQEDVESLLVGNFRKCCTEALRLFI